MTQNKVHLYLYDISGGLAKQISPMLVGKSIEAIWHTGVVVYNREYLFGGLGVVSTLPCQSPAGVPLRTIEMGTTTKSHEELAEEIAKMRLDFTPQSYSLTRKNCNNFSDALVFFLTGRHIPSYITGLPEEILSTPFGRTLLPLIESFEGNMSRGHLPSFSSGLPTDPRSESDDPLLNSDFIFSRQRDPNAESYVASVATCEDLPVSREESQTLREFAKCYRKSDGTAFGSVSGDIRCVEATCDLTLRLLRETDEKTVKVVILSLLSLLRLTVQLKSVLSKKIASEENLAVILSRSVSGGEAVRIASFSLICSLFGALKTSGAADSLRSLASMELLLNGLADAAISDHPETRQTASAVLFNCSVAAPRDGSSVHLACVLLEGARTEKKSSIVQRYLNALEKLFSEDRPLAEMIAAMDFALDEIMTENDSMIDSQWRRVRDLLKM